MIQPAEFPPCGDRKLKSCRRATLTSPYKVERRIEIGRHCDRDRVGAEARLAAPNGATCFGAAAESAVASPIMPSRIAISRIGGKPADNWLCETRCRRATLAVFALAIVSSTRLGVDVEAKTQ